VSLPQRIDPAINGWCAAFARTATEHLGNSLLDAVVGYCTVTVYFDPLRVDAAWLERELSSIASGIRPVENKEAVPLEVPVLYGGEAGPDIADVARFGACSIDDVIERHSSTTYRVYLVGFVPGFAYMAEVNPTIAAPRRSAPRVAVPVGSVGIAGGQTGIYPAVTPGGWNLIGRTPLTLFDADRTPPSLFKVGDAVRFHSISRREYDAMVRS
jgi:inhibitor of KinA